MLQKYNIFKVAKVFFLEPSKEHYLKEISKKSSLAHTSVKKVLQDLKNKGIIKEKIYTRESRKFPVYFVDTENKNYKHNKKLFNLDRIFSSGLIENLKEKLMPQCIVLFGSYLRGEDIEESDIDLFIESEKENIDLKKFEKKLGRKIQLHFKKNFNEYNSEMKNNILNGTVIYGYLEAF